MMDQTKKIIETADQYAQENCAQGIIHIPSWRSRKKTLAHKQQQEKQITSGLIGMWSCLESGSSYRTHYCKKTGYP